MPSGSVMHRGNAGLLKIDMVALLHDIGSRGTRILE